MKRLTTAQIDALFLAMKEASAGDRAEKGLDLCAQWGIKTSRTAVHECYARHFFGWQLERAAWTAQQTGTMPEYEKEKAKLISQKLFAEIANVNVDPKLLVLVRSLELEQGKLDLATRSAETRFKIEKDKLTLADRRVKLLESKMQRASAKLQELRNPKTADDAKAREAILDRVDELMGLKKS